MSEPRLVNVDVNCIPAQRGITPEELAQLIVEGWVFLDIMPIRREITGQEKLTIAQIPAAATHVAEPMIVFYKLVPVISPLEEEKKPWVN